MTPNKLIVIFFLNLISLVGWLTSSGQYFMHIQDDSNLKFGWNQWLKSNFSRYLNGTLSCCTIISWKWLVLSIAHRKWLVTRQGQRSKGKNELGEWYIGYMKQEDGGQYTIRPERDSLFLRPEEDWNFNSWKRKKALLRATNIFSKSDLYCYVSIIWYLPRIVFYVETMTELF